MIKNIIWPNLCARRYPFLNLIITLILISGFIYNLKLDLRPSDDNIFFYTTSQQISKTDLADHLDQLLIKDLSNNSYSEDTKLRYIIRSQYRNNYRLPTWNWSLASKIYDTDSFTNLVPYSKAIGKAFVLGSFFTYTMISIVLLVSIVAIRRVDIALSLALTLSTLFVLALIIEDGAPFQVFSTQNVLEALKNVAWFTLNSGAQFSIFGFTPRSALILLVLLVFLMRWTGHWFYSYLLLSASLLIHQSMATLVVGTVIFIDLILRTRILFKPNIVLLNLISLSIIAFHNDVINYLTFDFNIMLITMTCVIILLLVAISIKYCRNIQIFNKMHASKGGYNLAYIYDCITMILIGLLSAPIIFNIAHRVDNLQQTYFWFQLYSRLISIFWPVILLAFFMFIINNPTQIFSKYYHYILSILCIILLIATISKPNPFPDYNLGLEHIAKEAEYSLNSHITTEDEPIVYLAMSFSLEKNRPDFFIDFLKRRNIPNNTLIESK